MPRTPRRLDQRRQQFHRMRRLGYRRDIPMEQAGCQVLVVDDDADTRDALVAALESDQFCVEQASSGAAALERCAHLPAIDVVLLDLHMPGMKGTDVLEQLKAKPATAKARVILLTADSQATLIDLAGQAKVLHKPFSLDGLAAAV